MAIGQRRATVALTADPRGLDKGLAAGRSKFRAFASTIVRGISGAASKVGSLLGRAFDPLGKGFDMISDVAGGVLDYEKAIARLAISQGKSNDEMADFRGSVAKISGETGIAREELMKGVGAYQALTGDTEGATAALSTFARVSQATGSKVEDVSTAAAALSQAFKIDPKNFEDAFSILNVQGKAGAIEIRDLAGELSSLAPQFAKFAGGQGVTGMTELGAAAQIVRRNFGSASEAGTGTAALMTAMVKSAKKLKKEGGVSVFDKKGKLRSFSAIVKDISNSKLMNNQTKLFDVLGSSEALRALQALTDNWTDFQGLVQTTDVSSIGKDMEQYLNSPAGQLEKSMNGMKLAIAEAFTPERIQEFAKAVEGAGGAIVWLVDRVSDLEEGFRKLAGDEQLLMTPEQQAEYRVRTNQSGKGVMTGYGMGFGEANVTRGIQAGLDYESLSKGKAGWHRQQGAAAEVALGMPGATISPERRIASSQATQAGLGAATGLAGPLGGLAIAKLGESMKRGMAGAMVVTLVVDGNVMARAANDAPDQRRKPGGHGG